MRSSGGRQVFRRLERVLLGDKIGGTGETVDVMKNDIIKVLSGYMDVKDLSIAVSTETGGGYSIVIRAKASRISMPNVIK